MELFCSLYDDKYARDAGHWRSRLSPTKQRGYSSRMRTRSCSALRLHQSRTMRSKCCCRQPSLILTTQARHTGLATFTSNLLTVAQFSGHTGTTMKKTWNNSWNKCGTEQAGTGSNMGDQGIAKSLRSKDGLVFFSAHNRKVEGSNPSPATNLCN